MTNQIFTEILTYMTDFSGFINRFTGDIGSAGVHYDWLIIFFFVFVILIVALNLGRSRTLLALLSLYAASFLETHFIYFNKVREVIKDKPDFWLHIGLFLLIYIVVFAIINRSFLKNRLTLSEASIFAVVLVAIVETGFLATIVISYFPDDILLKIPSKLLPYFATEKAQFWWAVIPILTLLFSGKKKDAITASKP